MFATAMLKETRTMKRLITLAAIAVFCTLGTTGEAVPLPTVTSANLTAHFDASDVNNDGGATNPGDGNDVSTWTDLVGGLTLNDNFPTDGRPTFIAAGSGGIGNRDTVRFVSTGAGPATQDDLMFNNAMNFNAQTIYAVATMVDNGSVLATIMSNAFAGLNIRQTTAVSPAYFTGNASDFINANGVFHINGNPRFDIPGGFGAQHVVKAVRNAAANYTGFRFSDNITNSRRWNGDIAEVLIYDNKLNGNEAAQMNQYLNEKYGASSIPPQVIDELLSDTSQVATDPFVVDDPRHVAGVNFHYSAGAATSGTLHGIGFDNINLSGAAPPAGPFALLANVPGVTLTLNFPFTSDNTLRTQNTNATGPDAATLNTVANQMFYLGGLNHPSATMTFAGLATDQDFYVQVLGGDAGWTGDLVVQANGVNVATWMSVADGSANNASLFGFFTTSDSLGQLQLDFAISAAGSHAAIGGIILTERTPEPTTLSLLGLGALGLWRRRRRSR